MSTLQDQADAASVRRAWYRAQLERGVATYQASNHLATLLSVRVLWLDQNLFLWGLPYEQLRAGQSPRDIAEGPVGKRDFIGLDGMSLHAGARALRDAFLTEWKAQGVMPGYAFEWSYVDPPSVPNIADLVAAADADAQRVRERLAAGK